MNSDSRAMLTASVLAAVTALAFRGCEKPVVPVPPKPDPIVVDPTPQPAGEYRVLIIEETAARSTLKPAQLAILTSAPLRAWLVEQKAAFRVLDQDADMQFADEQWRKMLAKKGDSLPWLIVTGKGEFAGPLPATVEDTKAVVTRYKP